MTSFRYVSFALLIVIGTTPGFSESSRPSKTPSSFVCGTGIGLNRTAEALALGRYQREQLRAASLPEPAAFTEDQGGIAVMEDDGATIIQPNAFDLANKSVTFTPILNGFRVQSGDSQFDQGRGTSEQIRLGDDDTSEVSLPFPFTFYGVTYRSVFLNSDGNITFTAADTASSERDLRRIADGVPRISPFFNDLFPVGDGRITVEKLSDRVLFSWLDVGEFATPTSATGNNTFQIVLNSSGVVRFSYRTIMATTGVVAVAPGADAGPLFELVDFSAQAVASDRGGLIAEVFASELQINLTTIAQRFYQTHADVYDGLILFTEFDINLGGGAFAFALPVRNEVRGIRRGRTEIFDFGSFFGSQRRLQVFVQMGWLGKYPADPGSPFLGTNSTVAVLGQEFGHRWLAYLDTDPPSLLGRDSSHWSFLHNSFASVMEGNEIAETAPGRFNTTGATERYSPLDQYVMGLRTPSEVPPWFVVTDPVLPSPLPPDFNCARNRITVCPPYVGLSFTGTRKDVTINDIVSGMGPRTPPSDQAPKDFGVAFILLTQRGKTPDAATVQKLDLIRTNWEQFFVRAIENRGTMSADLRYLPPAVTSVSPASGSTAGGSTVTIDGSGFQPDSRVTIGGQVAPTVFRSIRRLTATVPARTGAGTADVVVRNPRDGQTATVRNGFLYLAPATSEVQATLRSNGSFSVETAAASSTTTVGFAMADSGFGVAVFKSFAGNTLVSEASVPASTAGTSFTIYAERGTAVSTGLAIANPNSSAAANLTLRLSSGASTTLPVPARGQQAKFIHELFPAVGTSFTGTVTLTSDIPVAVLALRGTVNLSNQFILTTLPVTAGIAASSDIAVFPQIANGSGYRTEIILVNTGAAATSGTVDFSVNVATDRGSGASFPFDIPVGSVWRIRTTGSGDIRTGYATVRPAAGRTTPTGTAIFSLSAAGNLKTEAGVPAQASLRRGRLFAVRKSGRRTGVAMVNTGTASVQVTLTPFRADGTAGAAQPITLSAGQHRAAFFDELIASLPEGFDGNVQLEATGPVHVVSLRGTTNNLGEFLLSTMPVADLDRLPAGPIYFPHIADGAGFTTEFQFINVGASSLRLQFFSQSGQSLPLSVR